MVPFIVILTGLPAAGKTTISRPLAEATRLPVVRSDTIKEAIFDSQGYGTRDRSAVLTIVSRDISLRMVPEIGPCILDVFMPSREARLMIPALAETIIEVHCSISYELAWARFIERARSGNRHPGHVDADVTLDYFRSTLMPQEVDTPFVLGGPLLVIDTTYPVDITAASEWVIETISMLEPVPPTRGTLSA
jgi:predicted kinase